MRAKLDLGTNCGMCGWDAATELMVLRAFGATIKGGVCHTCFEFLRTLEGARVKTVSWPDYHRTQEFIPAFKEAAKAGGVRAGRANRERGGGGMSGWWRALEEQEP